MDRIQARYINSCDSRSHLHQHHESITGTLSGHVSTGYMYGTLQTVCYQLCTVDVRTTAGECKVGTSITSRFVETKVRVEATNSCDSFRCVASRRAVFASVQCSAVHCTRAANDRTFDCRCTSASTDLESEVRLALQTAAPHRKVERTEEWRNREGRQVQVKSERYTIITRIVTQSHNIPR